MPLFSKIEKARKLVISTGSGVLTMADALAYQDKLQQDPEFDPSFSQLLDFTHVTKVELETEDIRRLAQRSLFSTDSRRAILVSSDVAYGLARMFEVLRESLGEKGIQVFRNLDEALDWVLAENTAT
jgi:hypothetical protein